MLFEDFMNVSYWIKLHANLFNLNIIQHEQSEIQNIQVYTIIRNQFKYWKFKNFY